MALRNGGMITQGEYNGKTLKEAMEYATNGGFTTRIVEENGRALMVTADYKSNRINFRVREGIVIDAFGG
jgi:hypothetical protein